MTIASACELCGGLIRSTIPDDWHPDKLASRAEWDMQDHLRTHAFAEVLRYEIRQDLNQVPDEQRPAIVRDIYRNLLGHTRGRTFVLGDPDGRGVYSIDEVLGGVALYRLWRTARACTYPGCRCRQP